MSGGGSGTFSNGQQRLIELKFCPTSSGSKSGTLTIASDASGSPNTVSLVGVAASAPTPQISVNPTALDLGSNPPGSCSAITKSFTITASGGSVSGAVSISGAKFVLTSPVTTFSLSNGQSTTMTVGFCPDATFTGNASGTVMVSPNSSSVAAKTVSLSGVSVLSGPRITSISPSTFQGSTTPRTVTINGTGFENPKVILSRLDQSSFEVPPDQILSGATSNRIDISIATSEEDTWTVKVKNQPSGRTSEPASFEVTSAYGSHWGRVLGEFQGVWARSNGDPKWFFPLEPSYVTHRVTGVRHYVGVKYQCVEYVSRFYRVIFDKDIRLDPLTYGDDINDAYRIFDTASLRANGDLVAIPDGSTDKPQRGDIIVFHHRTNPIGHVAIVRDSNATSVTVIQQNFKENSDDAAFVYPATTHPVTGAYTVNASDLGNYRTDGWLRLGKAPRSGWWWNDQEGGRGLLIERRGPSMFVGLFGYEPSGLASWYVAAGTLTGSAASGSPAGSAATGTPAGWNTGSTFQGTMLSYRDGQTLTGAWKAPTQDSILGGVSIEFHSATDATVHWPDGGGSTRIKPFDFNGANAMPQGAPETGWWWNEDEPGRGFGIEVQNNLVFVIAYAYDGNGRPVWYMSMGNMIGSDFYQGTWQQYGYGQALKSPYKAPEIVNANVGSITVQFEKKSTARLTLPNGQVVNLKRFEVK